MKPRFTVLGESDIDRVIDGALSVLERVGVHVGSPRVLDMVGSQDGARVRGDRVRINRDLVERCLSQAPSEVRIYGQDSSEPLLLAGDEVNYVAGAVAPYVYDEKISAHREPTSRDLVEFIKVVDQCDYVDFQTGALLVSDVPRPVAGSYRYYLCFLYSPKPIFSGAFGTEDLAFIKDMLAAMAGGEKELEERPVAVIAANPSSPLGLSEIVAENIASCARYKIPVMLIPIPLAGGSSPVTLAGTLVQHTAENLGALVVSQTARPGAPVVFGGGPSIMDMRSGMACQASTESVMMGASIGQIAKRLRLPSATNTGRADSKRVDYQAGEESGIGLTLMALAGVNMIRGCGTLEYANVVSKEKLLIDNEICGMAKRMIRGMECAEDALALDLIEERAASLDGYLSASHTFKWFQSEAFIPSKLIDRGSRREFEDQACKNAYERAAEKAEKILAEYTPREMDKCKKKELDRIITAHAKQHGMDRLPVMEVA